MGTRDGLEQVPSSELNQFRILRHVTYPLLAGKESRITDLRFGRDGALWVGTNVGLFRFLNGSYAPVIPGQLIVRLHEASNGHILAVTSGGLVEWDGTRTIAYLELASQLNVNANEIFDVAEDSQGALWICTAKGVARKKGPVVQLLPNYGVSGRGATRVYDDPQGNIWIAKAKVCTGQK